MFVCNYDTEHSMGNLQPFQGSDVTCNTGVVLMVITDGSNRRLNNMNHLVGNWKSKSSFMMNLRFTIAIYLEFYLRV